MCRGRTVPVPVTRIVCKPSQCDIAAPCVSRVCVTVSCDLLPSPQSPVAGRRGVTLVSVIWVVCMPRWCFVCGAIHFLRRETRRAPLSCLVGRCVCVRIQRRAIPRANVLSKLPAMHADVGGAILRVHGGQPTISSISPLSCRISLFSPLRRTIARIVVARVGVPLFSSPLLPKTKDKPATTNRLSLSAPIKQLFADAALELSLAACGLVLACLTQSSSNSKLLNPR